MTSSKSILSRYPWQDEKRLRSGDCVWIITDVEAFTSSLYPWSASQKWYRVGGLDLITMRIGYFIFSTDDVRAFLKAGVPPAPWRAERQCGFEITRIYHGPSTEGRFREKVKLLELDADLLAQGAILRRYFERTLTFQGNSEPGMWKEIEAWASRENLIEAAALAMPDWFSAGDVKIVVAERLGSKTKVGTTLIRLVEDGALTSNGKRTKGARYRVTLAPSIQRVDWVA